MDDLFDQYSLLHFATGVTAYFWGVGPWWWFFGHLAWEGFENHPEFSKFFREQDGIVKLQDGISSFHELVERCDAAP